MLLQACKLLYFSDVETFLTTGYQCTLLFEFIYYLQVCKGLDLLVPGLRWHFYAIKGLDHRGCSDHSLTLDYRRGGNACFFHQMAAPNGGLILCRHISHFFYHPIVG